MPLRGLRTDALSDVTNGLRWASNLEPRWSESSALPLGHAATTVLPHKVAPVLNKLSLECIQFHLKIRKLARIKLNCIVVFYALNFMHHCFLQDESQRLEILRLILQDEMVFNS